MRSKDQYLNHIHNDLSCHSSLFDATFQNNKVFMCDYSLQYYFLLEMIG